MDLLNQRMSHMQEVTEAMRMESMNKVACVQYYAAAELYRKQMECDQKIARAFLQANKEENDRIFKDAMNYLDWAIDHGNVQLAKAALDLIESMRKLQPNFYQQYYKIRFGIRR